MKNILLVEDDTMHCALVQDILEMEKYCVRFARDGEEALSILESESFDLVLTDINMFKMNGIELLERVREMKKPQKIIAMTAELRTRSGQTFEEIGFDGFIQKPFKINQFREYVKSFVGDD